MFESYCAPTLLSPSCSDRPAVPRRPSHSQGVERGESALEQAKEGTEAAILPALLQTHNPSSPASELLPLAGNVHDQFWPCQLSALASPSLDVPQDQTCPAATDFSPPLATAFYTVGDSTAEHPEGTAAVPMADVLLPLCHSSLSADSRQSCSPGPSCKRNRHEQVADDEAKVISRRERNREAARRTRAKRMDTIASLSDEVQLLASMNQGLSMQLQWAVCQVDAMGQENGLLRRILIAHATEMTGAENVLKYSE
ncbi:hypothetical protein WJX82_002895 [Trebouxia sp. C0006]